MDLVSFSREFSLEQPEVNEAGKVLGGVSIREWFNAKLSSTDKHFSNVLTDNIANPNFDEK